MNQPEINDDHSGIEDINKTSEPDKGMMISILLIGIGIGIILSAWARLIFSLITKL